MSFLITFVAGLAVVASAASPLRGFHRVGWYAVTFEELVVDLEFLFDLVHVAGLGELIAASCHGHLLSTRVSENKDIGYARCSGWFDFCVSHVS